MFTKHRETVVRYMMANRGLIILADNHNDSTSLELSLYDIVMSSLLFYSILQVDTKLVIYMVLFCDISVM